MTPDQPAASAGLHPETMVICAGRPGHAAGGPLNVPVVLASNFQAGPGTGEDSRAYSRTDATPGWEALEAVVGQLEGGHGVAFSSGTAGRHAGAIVGVDNTFATPLLQQPERKVREDPCGSWRPCSIPRLTSRSASDCSSTSRPGRPIPPPGKSKSTR